ncbi:D-alanine--D-alanine ligase [Teredinibacter sp. KSP-S5-2]|uniref:D-alanine--D-alanine ligase n=1 Tax=Teredinibacter sp. KSP-S5-2 TaxID=3034506 RepID=UPI0029343A84|nr:D-alanine--D-alanine ligase [Teredinibacter sp. KSP-S5-2]WNO10108.1 D-alanine--D-alanine ligase [Teredinibacter sp. KSP-S5-2]
MPNQTSVNEGLPPLDLEDRPVSFFEFWPAWFFYIPVVFYWLWLSIRYRSFGLPMLANPEIELGGMVGESKSAILHLAGEYAAKYILRAVTFVKDPALSLSALSQSVIELAEQSNINMPFVIKPDKGCRGTGVRVIRSIEQLNTYLHAFPDGQRCMVQTLAPYSAEAGVFYERMPGETQGRITSLTLKYVATVKGDGATNLQTLIARDPRASKLYGVYVSRNAHRLTWVPKKGEDVALTFAGSHARGAIFRNGWQHITPKLEAAIDRVLQDVRGFHYGRLDIKFESTEKLEHGEAFTIIEINGASSEAVHIWDSRAHLWEAFGSLFRQYRILFQMGDRLRAQGYQPPPATTLIKVWLRELKLSKHYPESN